MLLFERGRAPLPIELVQHATVERLRAVDQLRVLSTTQLEQVAELAERVVVDEGEILAKEGRVDREFFLILSGTVAVTEGGRPVGTLGPGSFFGEVIATNVGPRQASVTAVTEVEVLIIGPREFASMLEMPGFRDAMPLAVVTSRSLTPTRSHGRRA
jgi:CRP-like cAMP-binding protein